MEHLVQEACKPFFLAQELEILRVAKHYAFGASACRQPWSALIITLRAPPGLALLRLPKWIGIPNGCCDHPSWHDDSGGMVPQYVDAMPLWFVRGCIKDDDFVVTSKVAARTQDPLIQRQLQAIKDRPAANRGRLARSKHNYMNKVQARPKGADVSDLRDPRRLSRPSAQARLHRASRSRSRSPSASRSASRSRNESPASAAAPAAAGSGILGLATAHVGAAAAFSAAAAPPPLGPTAAGLSHAPNLTAEDLLLLDGVRLEQPDVAMGETGR